ncbi:MAG: 2-amino-4-hydroxy-6-hydroxymethyldihydropteridine diphosphokinase [Lachnospiraceae bacterium]|nr:2-amino-4-hydroxy-6-hydroxymethyldihydropteridine diphosphokinase [Lachnospiraceae bacterium]
MDQIRIDNLEVYAYHGVFPEENEKGQPFFINMVLYTDLRGAGLNDDLLLSTHYGEVSHLVNDWMKSHTVRLIETVAETLAAEILQSFPLIHALDIEIRKPKAPIGLPFESVSVKIHRGWHTVYVAIGSNMGEKDKYIQLGLEELKKLPDTFMEGVSDIIVTKPYGGVEQEDFLNGAVKIKTLFTPEELLVKLHEIEEMAERKRTLRWGPRTLDLDIIFYDKIVYESDTLIIPHVDMENRDFVLKPMCQLAPNFRHPLLGKTMEQLYGEVCAKSGE